MTDFNRVMREQTIGMLEDKLRRMHDEIDWLYGRRRKGDIEVDRKISELKLKTVALRRRINTLRNYTP